MHSREKKIAVILAAHGEAESSGFLENYRVSRRTLRHAASVMEMPSFLQIGISMMSSLKKQFKPAVFAGSPHNRIAREQAARLQAYLDTLPGASGYVFDVHAAYAASDPAVEEIIEATQGCDGQIILSMSPFDNELTCGQICGYLAARGREDELGRIKVVSRFWCDPALHELCADHVSGESAAHGLSRSGDNVLLLLYHGTLVTTSSGEVPGFRTGLHEANFLADSLAKLIGSDGRHPYGRVMTAFLNHDVGGRWTSPSFEDVAQLLRDSGAGNVALFAAGYFADGNETVGRESELRTVLKDSSIRTISCLNDSEAFIRYLGNKVAAAVSQIMHLPFPAAGGS